MNPPIPMPPVGAAVPWPLIIAILVIGAAVAWGLTEAVKKTALAKYRVDHDATAKQAKKRLWWTPMLAALSILIGFGIGCAIGGYEWKTLYGGGIGAVGGALSTTIVAAVKGNITGYLKKAGKADK